jgi:hypothetical protein
MIHFFGQEEPARGGYAMDRHAAADPRPAELEVSRARVAPVDRGFDTHRAPGPRALHVGRDAASGAPLPGATIALDGAAAAPAD